MAASGIRSHIQLILVIWLLVVKLQLHVQNGRSFLLLKNFNQLWNKEEMILVVLPHVFLRMGCSLMQPNVCSLSVQALQASVICLDPVGSNKQWTKLEIWRLSKNWSLSWVGLESIRRDCFVSSRLFSSQPSLSYNATRLLNACRGK